MTDGKRVAALLRVIDAARAEAAFMAADEADGSATARTRHVRLGMIRDALLGMGDAEARKALGLHFEVVDAAPTGNLLAP